MQFAFLGVSRIVVQVRQCETFQFGGPLVNPRSFDPAGSREMGVSLCLDPIRPFRHRDRGARVFVRFDTRRGGAAEIALPGDSDVVNADQHALARAG